MGAFEALDCAVQPAHDGTVFIDGASFIAGIRTSKACGFPLVFDLFPFPSGKGYGPATVITARLAFEPGDFLPQGFDGFLFV